MLKGNGKRVFHRVTAGLLVLCSALITLTVRVVPAGQVWLLAGMLLLILALFALSMALNLALYAVRKENEEDMI